MSAERDSGEDGISPKSGGVASLLTALERIVIPAAWFGLVIVAVATTKSKGPILIHTGGNELSRPVFVSFMLGGAVISTLWLQGVARSNYLGYALPIVAGAAGAFGTFFAVSCLVNLRLHEACVDVPGTSVRASVLASLTGEMFTAMVSGFVLVSILDYVRRLTSGGKENPDSAHWFPDR